MHLLFVFPILIDPLLNIVSDFGYYTITGRTYFFRNVIEIILFTFLLLFELFKQPALKVASI
jgi:hypothetical protein